MSVERLLNSGIIRIDDLHPVEKQPEKSVRQKYEELKESKLYDKINRQWIESISSDGNVYDNICHSGDQLIDALLINLLYGKEKAIEQFNEIKEKFFDKGKYVWNRLLRGDQIYSLNSYQTSRQLLGVLLIEQLEGKTQAKEEFGRVKEMLFDDEYAQYLYENKETGDRRDASDQLLGVLVTERLYGRDEAQKEYARVHNLFFDQKSNNWIAKTKAHECIPVMDTIDTELLDVLVTIRLSSKTEAREKFNNVKERFFDYKNQRWRDNNEGTINDSGLYLIFSQRLLLALWVEKELKEDEEFVPQSKPLPEIRKY